MNYSKKFSIDMKVSMSKLSPSERRRIQWWWWGRRVEQEIVLSSAPGLRGPRIRSWPLSAGSWECQWPPDTQVGHISSPYHLITCIIYRLPRLPHHSLPAGDMSDEEYAEEESMWVQSSQASCQCHIHYPRNFTLYEDNDFVVTWNNVF